MTMVMGQVGELWRYPVKSLGGQQLSQASCGVRGIEGERRWAVRGTDGKLGSGKTTRRFRRMPGLLAMSSFLDDAGQAWVRFPDGELGRVDDPATSVAVGAVVDEEVGLVEEGSGLPLRRRAAAPAVLCLTGLAASPTAKGPDRPTPLPTQPGHRRPR